MEILKGIRVLDFGRYIAGPFCGALLGDLGADVIRIEKVAGSEDRYTTPVNPGHPDGEVGSTFLQLNRNKRGMTLNPKKPGADVIKQRLIQSADVVLANMPQSPPLLHGLNQGRRRIVRELTLSDPSGR